MPAPSSVQEVRRFIGMSQTCEPLRWLTQEDQEFSWGREDKLEFDKVRGLINYLLTFYDVTKPATIQCDASTWEASSLSLKGL